MKNLVLRKGTAIVIVAHPDDETIWMGGTILSHPELRWTIFSLCRGNDKDRMPRFKKICRTYGARALITSLEDDDIMNIRESIPVFETYLTKKLSRSSFTYLFTHGYNGEYGHARHRGLHLAVKHLLRKKTLRAEHAFTFSYRPTRNASHAVPNHNARFQHQLSKKTFAEKQNLIHTHYGFTKNSFEYKSSGPIETFQRLLI